MNNWCTINALGKGEQVGLFAEEHDGKSGALDLLDISNSSPLLLYVLLDLMVHDRDEASDAENENEAFRHCRPGFESGLHIFVHFGTMV